MLRKTPEYFITGGQTVTHRLRMFRANLRSLFIGLGILFLLTFLTACWIRIPEREAYHTLCWISAYAQLSLPGMKDRHQCTQLYRAADGKTGLIRDIDVLRDPTVIAHKNQTVATLYSTFLISVLLILASMIGAMAYFTRRGWKKHEDKEILRGSNSMTLEAMKKKILSQKLNSDLEINGFPLIKNQEIQHIMTSGANGTGKSNLIKTLIPQIRARGDRAIVVDMVGEYIEKFYQPGDIILNPFDARSVGWSPWAECELETDYDNLAASLVPPTKKYASTSYWEEAAREIIAGSLKILADKGEPTLKKLLHLFYEMTDKEFALYFRNTPLSSYVEQGSNKDGLRDLRRSINNHLKFMKYVDDRHPFSVRKWIEAAFLPDSPQRPPQGQWIFLTSTEKTLESVKSFYTCLMHVAITALQSCPPDLERRLWFVIDELPALKMIPSLEPGLTRLRKYGGCILAGFQNFAQLKNTYGDDLAHSMLDQFATRFYFRNTDPEITSWIQKSIGDMEVFESQKSESYGAHEVRDGETISKTRKTMAVVMASEIASLPNLECFVQLPPLGVTKLKIPLVHPPKVTEAFIRLPSKFASAIGFAGESDRRTAVYRGVHEDSRTASTPKSSAKVEFPKKSIMKPQKGNPNAEI